MENPIFGSAKSLSQYQESCDVVAGNYKVNDVPTDSSSEDEHEVSLSPAVTQIGHYSHAVHYADGLFSEIYKVPSVEGEGDNSEGFVALKVTTPSMMVAPHNSEREARILKSISSCGKITPLIATFRTSESRFVLVFPFLPYALDSLLHKRKLKEHQVKSHLRDMLNGLNFLHENNIIHRDIKPSNILLKSSNGPAYISDFGIAWSGQDVASEHASEKITDVGTTCYRPPEILFGQKDYDFSLDMWAAGCVVAEAASLDSRSLFEPGQLGTELALIQSIFMSLGTPDERVWPSATRCPDWGKMEWRNFKPRPWSTLLPNAPPSARDLVSKLICYEQNERLSANRALEHPYLASGG